MQNLSHSDLAGGISGCKPSVRGTASNQKGVKGQVCWTDLCLLPLPSLDTSRVQVKQLTGLKSLVNICAEPSWAIKVPS